MCEIIKGGKLPINIKRAVQTEITKNRADAREPKEQCT